MKNRMRFVVAALAAVLLVAGIAIAQENAKVAGKWESSFETPQGTMTQTFTFEQTGDKLKGTVSGRGGETPLEGTIKGKEIKFTVTRQGPQGEIKIEYAGVVEGDTIKGTSTSPRGTRDWSAKRAK